MLISHVASSASRETYNQLQHWLTDARSLANNNCALVVVGNKSDLQDQREVIPICFRVSCRSPYLLKYTPNSTQLQYA